MNTEAENIKNLRSHYQDETNSSYLYGLLCQFEKDNQLFTVNTQMPEAETNHAHYWKEKLEAAALTFGIGKLIGVSIGG
jgi:hypothetical protein